MDALSLLNAVEWAVVSNTVAAGVTDIDTTAIETKNADLFTWLVKFGAITGTAVLEVVIEASEDDVTYVPLDTRVVVPDDDDSQLLVVECYRPNGKYSHIRLHMDRTIANAVVESVIAGKSHLRSEPATQGATVSAVSACFISPEEE